MGWTGIYKDYCNSPMNYLIDQFSYETNIDPSLRDPDTTIRCSVVERSKKGFNYFFIIKLDKHDGSTKYATIIALVRMDKKEYYFKTMAEEDGPYAYAPASFIEKVERYIPIPPGKYAENWRDVSKKIAERDKKAARYKREFNKAARIGDYITMAERKEQYRQLFKS